MNHHSPVGEEHASCLASLPAHHTAVGTNQCLLNTWAHRVCWDWLGSLAANRNILDHLERALRTLILKGRELSHRELWFAQERLLKTKAHLSA